MSTGNTRQGGSTVVGFPGGRGIFNPVAKTGLFVYSTGALNAPDAPIIGVAISTNSAALVYFNNPINNGGSPITEYLAVSNPGSVVGTGSGSPLLVEGLTNGTAYNFTALAVNVTGTSVASGTSTTVTPARYPDPPTIGTATAGNTQSIVSFTAGSAQGSTITGFVAVSSPGSVTGTSTASPATVTGLTNGTPYTFRVSAVNALGTSTLSDASNSIIPYTVPIEFSNIAVVSTASNLVVTFDTVTDLSTSVAGFAWSTGTDAPLWWFDVAGAVTHQSISVPVSEFGGTGIVVKIDPGYSLTNPQSDPHVYASQYSIDITTATT